VTELNSVQRDGHPWLTPDGLALYFASDRSGAGSDDLWVATRTSQSGSFDPPQMLAAVNSTSSDSSPTLSADGLELYFASSRMGGLGGSDLWRSTRASPAGDFGAPTTLSAVNSVDDDWDPALSFDGLTLYFTSNRAGGLGVADVWAATRPSLQASFSAPALVPGANSSSTDAQAWISADGLRLYFGSNRAGGLEDLWVAGRSSPQASFGAPAPIAELNTTDDDWGPSLSLDERTIFFHSNRPGGLGDLDIWQATRSCLEP
jgi:Tol biopolymer transport system component